MLALAHRFKDCYVGCVVLHHVVFEILSMSQSDLFLEGQISLINAL